ncbi:M14 family zinc carboxypeptidase [Photobacterium sp. TY1-4]|uniref:M14 family zinc carboxypeptidase n=1 Tax=Photobacterium sp. TY1-4 TaxID=2899122 RepID=UPI0021BF89C5|nr:M14 family zinc carboxypeptidase [Photobacterium sp. TY1-4]UXI03921.1 DUF2817 domain-containing protein [Photobacterium sp. TY1-4]
MHASMLYARLPELGQLEALIKHQLPHIRAVPVETRQLTTVNLDSQPIPLYAVSLGNPDPEAPGLVIVGGVHGLERIGSQVVISFMNSLCQRLHWDSALQLKLQAIRLVFLPLLNPVGMAKRYRSNGNHVDLMRNAPLDSQEPTAWLVGGHRLSKHLPWYRGDLGHAMEAEAQALVDLISLEAAHRPLTLALDCHSGFGSKDRLWFPYAKSRTQPMRKIGDVYHLKELFFNAYPHQNYIFEPQALHYTCHGDLWDYLYDRSEANGTHLLPITLEMGSWRWVRKNPLQLIDRLGLFHPMKPHRIQRVLRTHLTLMEFLINATYAYPSWYQGESSQRHADTARALWYPDASPLSLSL